MDRRKFFRDGSLFTLGGALVPSFVAINSEERNFSSKSKKAKNIILLVSDGMSSGTLNMADIYCQRKLGRSSHWLQLYKENKITRGLMDMGSATSIVTDSAAASSSWGSGFRVKNGSLNVGVNGEIYLPIWQKFKKAGKKAGCVTTVQITHATPAGFLTQSKSRNSMDDIALNYLDLGFDVLMGGGAKHFDAKHRKDGQDLFQSFAQKGYQIAKNRNELMQSNIDKPLLGTFFEDGLPYSIDRENIKDLSNSIPTLAEMTSKAIELMKNHKEGFVLQVEGGKVDWAAHANCIGGLLYDQIAFDDALKVAIDFAEKDGNTLVIVTSDHGNANPGLLYGKNSNDNFDSLHQFKHTNEWILNGFHENSTISQIIERVEFANNFVLSNEEAEKILSYYKGQEKGEDGLYNYRKMPFGTFSEMQKSRTSVGWIGTDHSADYTEIAMFGPGSEQHKPFIKNTDLHHFMLKVAEVENKF